MRFACSCCLNVEPLRLRLKTHDHKIGTGKVVEHHLRFSWQVAIDGSLKDAPGKSAAIGLQMCFDHEGDGAIWYSTSKVEMSFLLCILRKT